MTTEQTLTLCSLIVAALAVIVQPLTSQFLTRLQVQSSLRVANKQILAPMRQQWIESLRELISQLTAEAHYLYIAADDEESDQGAAKNAKARRRMMFLEQKIRLMVNAAEQDHQTLLSKIRELVSAAERSPAGNDRFADLHGEITDLARRVFKREWDRVKADL